MGINWAILENLPFITANFNQWCWETLPKQKKACVSLGWASLLAPKLVLVPRSKVARGSSQHTPWTLSHLYNFVPPLFVSLAISFPVKRQKGSATPTSSQNTNPTRARIPLYRMGLPRRAADPELPGGWEASPPCPVEGRAGGEPTASPQQPHWRELQIQAGRANPGWPCKSRLIVRLAALARAE